MRGQHREKQEQLRQTGKENKTSLAGRQWSMHFFTRGQSKGESVFLSIRARIRGPPRGTACLHRCLLMVKLRAIQRGIVLVPGLIQRKAKHFQSKVPAKAWFSNWARMGSITITRELVRNAHCWVPPQPYCIRNSWHGPIHLFFQAL